jgi:dTDP-4-amino-4,6-dideoxygalactose transaminase
MIRVFQPTLGRAELDAIAEVFADQWPGAGPRVKAFEKAFADYVGVGRDQMIAVTSCTEGLFQSVAAFDLGASSEVIMPTISFIGAAHAVRAVGAGLRLVDVDPLTLNPSPEHLERALTSRTRGIIVLHFGGRLQAIREIADLAKSRGIFLIEDAACALGGRQGGVSYGAFGDIGIWSFDAMKLLVTGDGGMIRVADEALRERIFNGVNLGGVTPGLEAAANRKTRWWEVNPKTWGRMSFMNDLTAAVGLVQLQHVDAFIRRRKEIARIYHRAFAAIPWINLPPPPPEESVPYFYWIQTASGTRDDLAVHLRERGIYSTFRYWPLHRTALYRDDGAYPGAELASETTLLLPVHQNLSDADIDRIVDSVTSFNC